MSAMCRRAVDTNAGFEEPQFHFMFKINVFRNRTTPSYLGSGVGNTPASVDSIPTSLKPPAQPIRVAARPRSKRKGPGTKQRRNKYVSPLFDDQGFPHPQDEWESMLPEVKAGCLIRKRHHAPQDCVM